MEITAERYAELKQQHEAFETWRNGRTSYKSDDVPEHLRAFSNNERAQLEVYEFLNTPPDTYFAYVDRLNSTITTFTGDVLGRATLGREYKSPAFGGSSIRQSITVKAINGHEYYGTYYKSSGDYCRLKRKK